MFSRDRAAHDRRSAPRCRNKAPGRRRGLRAGLEPLEGRALLSLAPIALLDAAGLYPSQLTPVGSALYFTTLDPTGGMDLNMFSGGVTQVLHRFVGTSSDTPDQGPGGDVKFLGALGSMLLFKADSDDPEGGELWATDGTASGTREVLDIDANGGDIPNFHLTNPVVLGGKLYFTTPLPGGSPTDVVWVTDGSAAGTHIVTDLGAGSSGYSADHLAAAGATLYFTAFGNSLYATDGTAGGTRLLKTFAPVLGQPSPTDLVGVGSTLYFSAAGGTQGRELWTSDGTAAGTRMVAQINPSAGGSFPDRLTAFGGKVLFTADDGSHGRELWTSDGTTSGTHMVADLDPGAASSAPIDLTVVGPRVYFAAADGSGASASGMALWVSDGMAGGTTKLIAINPTDRGGSFDDAPNQAAAEASAFAAVGSTLFLANDDGVHGVELWASDGTAAGTRLVRDINQGSAGSFPRGLISFGGVAFFGAEDGRGGNQLWSSDGTASGTNSVASFAPAENEDAVAFGLDRALSDAPLGGAILFSARDPEHGAELWRTDGAAAGSRLVKDLVPGPSSSSPAQLTAAGSLVFFTTTDPIGESASLWASDGTAVGTKVMHDFGQNGAVRGISALTAVGSTLYFVAADGTHGLELWASDGTAVGTRMVDDIQPGGADSSPADLTALNGQLYFSADDGTHGRELWTSDGTMTGTHMVTDIKPTAGSIPTGLTAFDGRLYFAADDGKHGIEPWTSDGTAAGTMLLADLSPGTASSKPFSFVTAGPLLYFRANDGPTNPGALWMTDGTTADTVLVADVFPVSATMIGLPNGRLVFAANDGIHGPEPWVSDGTAAGTFLLRDVNPGSAGSFLVSTPPQIFAGVAFFAATDGAHGAELWWTDGTSADTLLDQDINPGPLSSRPIPLGSLGGKLLVAADDGLDGENLLIDGGGGAPINHVPVVVQPGDQTLTAGGSFGFVVSATDPDAGQSLTYSMDAGNPAGAAIDASTGRFSWVANVTPGDYPITVRATDNGTPPLSDSATFIVHVVAPTTPPSLAPIADLTIATGQTAAFRAQASDADPGVDLVFSLDAPAPSGATIDPSTGAFTWGATATPGDYRIVARVTVAGAAALTAAQPFTVHVRVANRPPVLAPIVDFVIVPLQTVTFVARATDPDPNATLRFSLDPGAPAGATINPVTGRFSYTPASSLPRQSVTVRVTDNGLPPLSAVQTFTLTVLPNGPPTSIVAVRLIARRGSASAIVLTLNGPLDPTVASNGSQYSLFAVGPRRRRGPQILLPVALRAPSYDAAHGTITLAPINRLKASKTYQLGVSGLVDTFGRPFDGDRNGQPGGNFSATLAHGSVVSHGLRLRLLGR
jgi:ELWxxDGT repeat protein